MVLSIAISGYVVFVVRSTMMHLQWHNENKMIDIKHTCGNDNEKHTWVWIGALAKTEPDLNECCQCGTYRWGEISNHNGIKTFFTYNYITLNVGDING